MTEEATPSASRRQHVTRTRSDGPSTHRPVSRSYRRELDATLKLATRVLVTEVRRHSGAVLTLPTSVTCVSNIFSPSLVVISESTRRQASVPALPRRQSRVASCGQRGWLCITAHERPDCGIARGPAGTVHTGQARRR